MVSNENWSTLEEKKKSLDQEYKLQSKKVKKMREALVIEASTVVKFQLEEQLLNEEAHLADLSKEMEQVENKLKSATYPHSGNKQLESLLNVPVNGFHASEVNADYTTLRDLLSAKKFKEADKETLRVMLEVTMRENEGWLDPSSIRRFPCRDLRTIDRLWLESSGGRFGFSVQKEIYESKWKTLMFLKQKKKEFDGFFGLKKHFSKEYREYKFYLEVFYQEDIDLGNIDLEKYKFYRGDYYLGIVQYEISVGWGIGPDQILAEPPGLPKYDLKSQEGHLPYTIYQIPKNKLSCFYDKSPIVPEGWEGARPELYCNLFSRMLECN
ncbi:MAG: GUN4 domain-containing protein [Dolichospermum sp. JUN01]|nr:GUN4 domain-containing protein [Dolichospermum sp. JUN01]